MAVELRQWRVEHAGAQARAIEESLEHLRPWMAWAVEWPKPREDQLAMMREWEERRLAGTDEFLGVWQDGELVGSCGLHFRIGPGGVEIGYWIHPDHTRRGLATEVARLLCERAFSDPAIDRVEIHHDRANVGQRRRAAQARLRARRRHAARPRRARGGGRGAGLAAQPLGVDGTP